MVSRQRFIHQVGVGERRSSMILQPGFDGPPFVGVAVSAKNGILHHFLSDGAEKLGGNLALGGRQILMGHHSSIAAL